MANYLNNKKSNVENKMMNKVNNGTITLKQLLALDKAGIKIDMNKCENKIQVMQLIYEPNSEVGLCTVIAGNMYTAIIETNEDLEKYKECLKHLKERATHTPYGESIWQEGYNKFTRFNFKTGHYYVYYVVTNADMEALKAKIEGMNKDEMTIEDAKALQADLPPFVRAWQESSIDCTKDKSKKFKYSYKNFFKSLQVTSTYNKKFADNIVSNLTAISKTPGTEFVITLPSDINEKLTKDILGLINYAVKETAEHIFNDVFVFMHESATMDAYAQFAPYARENKELALFIKDIFAMCRASLDGNIKISREQYAVIRNVIYTKALDLCIDKHDVINIAISTAMCNVYRNDKDEIVVKDAIIDNFKAYPVKDIFPKEFFEVRTGQQWMEAVKSEDIIELTRDIADNEEIEVVDGAAVDGSVAFCKDITGTLKETNGKFYLYTNDTYEFELTKGLLTNKTYDETATPKEQTYDKGQYFDKATKNISTVKVMGKNKNILAAQRLLARFTASMPVDGTLEVVDVLNFDKTSGSNNQRIFLVIVK